MPQGYSCQNCGHAGGYHEGKSPNYLKCRVIECECDYFIWSNEDYEKHLSRSADAKSTTARRKA